MVNQLKRPVAIAKFLAATVVIFTLAGTWTLGQTPAAYRAPRTADGKPNLNGIWQALNTANWDIQSHAAQAGPASNILGVYSAEPSGLSVVEGNEIPYRPEMLARKKKNFEDRLKADPYKRDLGDPEAKCFLPGVPRATYMPFPFQIVQATDHILIAYEYANASRIIYMNTKEEAPIDSWMGWSRGRWEGETLVIDVTALDDQSWFDRAGNFHSDALHVVERYTAVSPNSLDYEATIEDPKVFTRPWKISMPLYRHLEKNAQLMEFKCVEFAEELLLGGLRKK